MNWTSRRITHITLPKREGFDSESVWLAASPDCAVYPLGESDPVYVGPIDDLPSSVKEYLARIGVIVQKL
jgi:hypothetical protein